MKIDRSLKLYDMVTVVGMENAIADVVSLVCILQDRKMGVHEGKQKTYPNGSCM
jgi:hypothetical protein